MANVFEHTSHRVGFFSMVGLAVVVAVFAGVSEPSAVFVVEEGWLMAWRIDGGGSWGWGGIGGW